MGPELGRAKRYAQCHFVAMGAVKRFMWVMIPLMAVSLKRS